MTTVTRFCLVTLTALASLTLPTQAAETQAARLAAVSVQAAPGAALQTSLDGVVEAVHQTTLSAQVPGAIVALRVKTGDAVRAGQELLRIDASAVQQNVAGSSAQVEAAKASLNLAAKELERQRQLHQMQYISVAALESAQAQWEAAQAQVQALQAQTRAAQAQSGFFVIKAPYAGIVSDVPVTLGDMAMPGSPLIKMHDPTALRVTGAVPQATVNALGKAIQSARYELPGLAGHTGPRVPRKVQVLPKADAATHTAQIRLDLPANIDAATPGMFARIWLPIAADSLRDGGERLYLPATAIVRRSEMTGVYVLDADGHPRLRQVRLGKAIGDRVEVLSGVRPGEQVAADPQAAARAR